MCIWWERNWKWENGQQNVNSCFLLKLLNVRHYPRAEVSGSVRNNEVIQHQPDTVAACQNLGNACSLCFGLPLTKVFALIKQRWYLLDFNFFLHSPCPENHPPSLEASRCLL